MKNKAAQELNKLRNKSLSKKRRKEIAVKAITTRWNKVKLDKEDINRTDKIVLAKE